MKSGNDVIMKYLISDWSVVNGWQSGGLIVVCRAGVLMGWVVLIIRSNCWANIT